MATYITLDRQRSRMMAPPIVLERSRKSGRKKRQSPLTDDLDTTERHLYVAARRTVKATDKGLRHYNKARRTSARRERDGAIIDFMPNAAHGMVVGTKHLAPIPLDLIRTMPLRRMTRSSLRAATWMIDRP